MTRESLHARITSVLQRAHDAVPSDEVDALSVEVFRWQRTRNPVLARIAEATLDGREVARIDDIPAIPTDVFKYARVSCFEASHTARTFRTSGTTREERGAHEFDDLSLYELAARSAARRWLLPEVRYRVVLLAADERDAPDSSLGFMLARFAEGWGEGDAFCVRHSTLDVARALGLIALSDGLPVALLGASYGFVHLMDAMRGNVPLPRGSVVMPTGGFKGRSRELESDAFHAALMERFGVERAQIVGEYGMTELSSQAYEAHREGAPPGVFRAPPWMRVSAVDPVTLERVGDGNAGLLRVVDLANLGSAIAIQTSDIGRLHPMGFEVLGRAPGATQRGCARALDAALQGER